MMMGRSGQDKHWCFNFHHSKAQWTKHYLSNDFGGKWFEEFPLWTTQDTASAAIKRCLEINGHISQVKTEQ